MVNALLSQLFLECVAGLNDRKGCIFTNDMKLTRQNMKYFCVHIVCNEIQVKVNLEITTFFFYLRFPYCPNFFWFGVVYKDAIIALSDSDSSTVSKWQAASPATTSSVVLSVTYKAVIKSLVQFTPPGTQLTHSFFKLHNMIMCGQV